MGLVISPEMLGGVKVWPQASRYLAEFIWHSFVSRARLTKGKLTCLSQVVSNELANTSQQRDGQADELRRLSARMTTAEQLVGALHGFSWPLFAYPD